MRGVIFHSMMTTTVTMPALVLLAVMGVYWLRRHYFPEAQPKPGIFALLAALLPLFIMVFRWPAQSFYYYSGEANVIICTYILYYLVGASVYAVCAQLDGQARGRAFRLFFVLLAAAAVVGLLVAFKSLMNILALLGIAVILWGLFHIVTKTIARPVWTWTPPQGTCAETQDAAPVPQPVAEALLPGLQKLLACCAAIAAITWLCLYVYTLHPFYVLLVLFWVAVTGFVLTRAEISPSRAKPSPETG